MKGLLVFADLLLCQRTEAVFGKTGHQERTGDHVTDLSVFIIECAVQRQAIELPLLIDNKTHRILKGINHFDIAADGSLQIRKLGTDLHYLWMLFRLDQQCRDRTALLCKSRCRLICQHSFFHHRRTHLRISGTFKDMTFTVIVENRIRQAICRGHLRLVDIANHLLQIRELHSTIIGDQQHLMNRRRKNEEIALQCFCRLLQEARILNRTGTILPALHGCDPQKGRFIRDHPAQHFTQNIVHVAKGCRMVLYRRFHGICLQLLFGNSVILQHIVGHQNTGGTLVVLFQFKTINHGHVLYLLMRDLCQSFLIAFLREQLYYQLVLHLTIVCQHVRIHLRHIGLRFRYRSADFSHYAAKRSSFVQPFIKRLQIQRCCNITALRLNGQSLV